tara:strand:+ start:19578 stop:19805 length:228 start_codon:yes stop_codon:yes gene_type:complete
MDENQSETFEVGDLFEFNTARPEDNNVRGWMIVLEEQRVAGRYLDEADCRWHTWPLSALTKLIARPGCWTIIKHT